MGIFRAKCGECRSKKIITFDWADNEDRDQVAKLLGGLPKMGLSDHIENFYLARLSTGGVIGCMGFEIHGDDAVLLRSLKVRRAFRKQGIATHLFEGVLLEVCDRGFSEGYAFTFTDKPVKLMEKFGAERCSWKEAEDAMDSDVKSELDSCRLSDDSTPWRIDL